MKQEQQELFETDEVETNEVLEKTTVKDFIRELKSLSIEVDIALDQVFDEDLERAKRTLENLGERIEQFLLDVEV